MALVVFRMSSSFHVPASSQAYVRQMEEMRESLDEQHRQETGFEKQCLVDLWMIYGLSMDDLWMIYG